MCTQKTSVWRVKTKILAPPKKCFSNFQTFPQRNPLVEKWYHLFDCLSPPPISSTPKYPKEGRNSRKRQNLTKSYHGALIWEPEKKVIKKENYNMTFFTPSVTHTLTLLATALWHCLKHGTVPLKHHTLSPAPFTFFLPSLECQNGSKLWRSS